MTFLIVGLIVFLGIHSVSIVAPQWRLRTIARMGEQPWKGAYSVVSIASFVLLVYGYGQARMAPVILYVPPQGMRHLTLLLMLPEPQSPEPTMMLTPCAAPSPVPRSRTRRRS